MQENLTKRFFNHVEKSENCWIWFGAKSEKGYGTIRIKNKLKKSHRISWILKNGTIPEGKLICHKCDNPPCVNPDHLFLGTAKDNASDSVAKGRWNHKNKKKPKKT